MPLGTTITSYVANLFPTDPVAPQVVGDFAQALPPNPVKGELVSHFADSFLPPNPVHPADLGSQLSDFIQILVQPDVSVSGDLI
ncbi:MAG: hypothetical protein M3Q19_10525 [Pseudomonadota bacterium]|nr:hypothetical protein [Pseudomonadota bacterium]